MVTLLENLIDPEVFSGFIEQKFVDKGVMSAVATVDTTLEGQAGSTLKFPSYSYIGDAYDYNENTQIDVDNIEQTYTEVKVKQIAKGSAITDWAVANGLGDATQETASQIATAMASKLDNDLEDAIEEGIKSNKIKSLNVGTINSDAIVDGMALWGEDLADKPVAFITDGSGLATLRKDENFINASEIQTANMIRGTQGEIWGASIILSNKRKKYGNSLLMKAGALRIIRKKGLNVEYKREADYKRTGIFADMMYGTYVYKPQDIIALVSYSELTEVSDKAKSVAGASGKTKLSLEGVEVPLNCSVVYKLGSSAVTPTFGTAIGSGYTALTDEEITAGSNTNASIIVVDSENKPIYYANVTVVKG